jgi:hypothetical protein
MRSLLLFQFVFVLMVATVQSFTLNVDQNNNNNNNNNLRRHVHVGEQHSHSHSNTDWYVHEDRQRRDFVFGVGALLAGLVTTPTNVYAAGSRYVFDEESGDYVEIPEEDWQTTWSKRYQKAQSMSTDEIFKAARGAGNLDLKQGPESEAARKRRAMSTCRDSKARSMAKVPDEKACTARVFAGETNFILGAPES